MDDLISRQAAIEEAKEWIEAVYCDHDEIRERMAIKHVINGIKELPPAEPQIIRCKDCKWNRTENRKGTKQWLPCRAIVTPDDFSCIYAEGKANG